MLLVGQAGFLQPPHRRTLVVDLLVCVLNPNLLHPPRLSRATREGIRVRRPDETAAPMSSGGEVFLMDLLRWFFFRF